MKRFTKVVMSAALAASCLGATENGEFVTHTELSYINTAGNTDTESFAVEAKAEKGWDKHLLNVKLEAYYSKDEETTTKNKWLVEIDYDYSMSDDLELGYLLGYKSDKFSSYDYQFYTGPGLKYKVLKQEKHKLKTKANLLYSEDDIRENPDTVPPILDETDSYLSYLVGANYKWQILDNLKFLQELTYRAQVDDSENYFIYSKSAVESKINGNFSMGVSYKIDYANQVTPDKVKSDRTLLVSLIIDY